MKTRKLPWRHGLAALALAGALAGAGAAPAVDTAADTALEVRVNAVSAELRCLVCQNQTLADSHAELAVDLKNQVREQLRAGRSEAEVVAYMTDRYGDFVRYRPPFRASTLLLWLGPALLALGGGLALWRKLGRARGGGAAAALSPEDAARAEALLQGGDKPG